MLEDRIRQRFMASAELQGAVAHDLTPTIAEASERLAECLLSGNKLMCCGTGNASNNAAYLARLLVNRHERERPGLPAMALTPESGSAMLRQLRTFGQAGDMLVLFTDSHHSRSVSDIIDAAHDRQLQVLVLDDQASIHIDEQLDHGDMELSVPATNATLCHELHLAIVHCLCDLIDMQIFGDEL